MKQDIIEKLTYLKQNPADEKVDHISLLHELYWEFSNGMTELKPVAMFYVDGFDDLPFLREKELWNLEKYKEAMQPFFEAHSDLIETVNSLLEIYEPNSFVQEFLDISAEQSDEIEIKDEKVISVKFKLNNNKDSEKTE